MTGRSSTPDRQSAVPDYRAVIDPIARRDQMRMLADEMTAANDRGLSDSVPAASSSTLVPV